MSVKAFQIIAVLTLCSAACDVKSFALLFLCDPRTSLRASHEVSVSAAWRHHNLSRFIWQTYMVWKLFLQRDLKYIIFSHFDTGKTAKCLSFNRACPRPFAYTIMMTRLQHNEVIPKPIIMGIITKINRNDLNKMINNQKHSPNAVCLATCPVKHHDYIIV